MPSSLLLNSVAAHAAAVGGFLAFLLFYEVPLNVRLIKADGSGQTLNAGFHSQRTWVRIKCALPLLGLASLPAGWAGFMLSFVGLGLLLAGIFLRTFGPLLNTGLKLAYKKRFYASPVSQSFPDKYIWGRVRAANPGQPDAALQETADEANHHFLNHVGLACALLYALTLGVLAWRA